MTITKIKYITFLLFLSISLILPSPAKAQKSTADLLDGVLSGMGAGSSSKSKEFDFDNLLNSMENEDLLFANVANAMDGYYDTSYEGSFSSYYPSKSYKYNVQGGAILPIMGRITSNFGFRPRFGRHHKGIDIALHVGDTVRAALDGTVTRVDNDPRGYGLFVCVRHDNGLETRYAHLSKILAIEGLRIMTGEPIGLGGSTGNSTGPHLHFETRMNGVACDPRTMFDFTNPGNRTLLTSNSLARLDAGYPSYNDYKGKSYTNQATNVMVQQAVPARSTYVVKAGDTVGSVAMKNGISVLTLCRLNMLSSNSTLEPGRMLKLR